MADGGGISGQSADLKASPVARERPFTPPLSRPGRTPADPHSTDLPNSPGFGLESQAQHQAGVAQLVEQRIRNAKVGSSTLFTGTRFQKATLAVAFCFSGAESALLAPCCRSRKRAPPRMSGKGCGLPFPFHTEAEHGTPLSKTYRSSTTPARPSSSAVALTRFQTARRPHAPSAPASLASPFQRAECRNLAHHTSSNPSPVTHHPSPVTHHPSPITHHPSPVTQLSNQSQLNIPAHLHLP